MRKLSKSFVCVSLLVLFGCGSAVVREAGPNTKRMFPNPAHAAAVNQGITTVVYVEPERRADWLDHLALPIETAQYGRFEYFRPLAWDASRASDAEMKAGVQRYCRQIGKRAVIENIASMKVAAPGQYPWRYMNARCD